MGSLCPELRYFTDQDGPKDGQHENEFWIFSNTKMNVTVRKEKVDKRKVFIFLFFMFTQSLYAIYTYASESSHYNLSENDMVYRVLSQRSLDISD